MRTMQVGWGTQVRTIKRHRWELMGEKKAGIQEQEVNYREHRGRRSYQNNAGQAKATDPDKSCHRNVGLHPVTMIQLPAMEFGSTDCLPGLWVVTRRDSWLDFFCRTGAVLLSSILCNLWKKKSLPLCCCHSSWRNRWERRGDFLDLSATAALTCADTVQFLCILHPATMSTHTCRTACVLAGARGTRPARFCSVPWRLLDDRNRLFNPAPTAVTDKATRHLGEAPTDTEALKEPVGRPGSSFLTTSCPQSALTDTFSELV